MVQENLTAEEINNIILNINQAKQEKEEEDL